MINEIIEWFKINWGLVLFYTLLIFLVFKRRILGFFSRKKKAVSNNEYEEIENFLDAPADIGTSLTSQRKSIIKNLDDVKKAGKLIMQDQKSISLRKKELGLKYSMYSNQLKLVNHMIETQQQMEEGLKQ